MALSYAARKRWALVILLIGLPVYVVAAVTVVAWTLIKTSLSLGEGFSISLS